MQKGVVIYKLFNLGWDTSDHFGDGCDLIAEKDNQFIKIELKAIDLNFIQEGKNATQHLTVNEIVTSTHLIITIFDNIQMKSSYIMSIRQFVENSGVKKYDDYDDFDSFIFDYRKLSKKKSSRRKNWKGEKKRLDFDFNFNPYRIDKWRLARFKDQWTNLSLFHNS